MMTIAWHCYLETEPGSTVRLPKAGTGMENPFVFDACAFETKHLGEQGRVQVVSKRQEHAAGESLITDLVFARIQ